MPDFDFKDRADFQRMVDSQIEETLTLEYKASPALSRDSAKVRDRNMSFAYCTNFQREGPGIDPRGAALAVAVGGGAPPSWLK